MASNWLLFLPLMWLVSLNTDWGYIKTALECGWVVLHYGLMCPGGIPYQSLRDLDAIFKIQFLIFFNWLVASDLMIMPSDGYHRTLLMTSQHWFRWLHGVDPVLCHHIGSLGHNELNCFPKATNSPLHSTNVRKIPHCQAVCARRLWNSL